jgi:hypothetical protein
LGLDPALLLLAVVAVGWAFGLRTAFVLVIFIGTHYLLSWGHLKGALLRTDFAMCSVLAVCLVKKSRYKLAGGLLGWAMLSRIFPGFLLIGPVTLLVMGGVRTRKIDRQLVALLASCAGTVLVVFLASCLYFGGTSIWHEWSQKIALHYVGGSDWDLGYRTIAEARFVHGVPVRAAILAGPGASNPSLFANLPELLVLVLLGLPALTFIRGLENHEAIAYGFVFMFLFSLASYYYYLFLCVPLLFFAPRLESPQHALGTAFMFLTGWAGYWLFSGWGPLRESWVLFRGWHQTFPTYYFLCCFIAVTVVQMIVLAATRARRLQRNEDADAQVAPEGP